MPTGRSGTICPVIGRWKCRDIATSPQGDIDEGLFIPQPIIAADLAFPASTQLLAGKFSRVVSRQNIVLKPAVFRVLPAAAECHAADPFTGPGFVTAGSASAVGLAVSQARLFRNERDSAGTSQMATTESQKNDQKSCSHCFESC